MKKLILIIFSVILLIVGLATVRSQVVIKNPTGIEFDSIDHNLATSYEWDIRTEPGNVNVQTLTFSNNPPIPLVNGKVVIKINVQPISFGRYRFVGRTVVNSVKSDDSMSSDVWERAPGAPSSIVVR